MNYASDQKSAGAQAQINVNETTGAGPVATSGNAQPNTGAKPSSGFNMRRVPLSAKLQKAGYWVVVAAALAVLIVLLGIFLPKLTSAVSTAFFAGLFVSLLGLLNLPKPAVWGNSLLGRKVFPVIQAPERDIMRLSWINGLMVFIFTFVFQLVASFIGPVLGGLLVFAGLIIAAVFYSRARSVIIKP